MNNDFYSYENNEDRSSSSLLLSETNVAFAKAFLWMFVGTFISFIIGLLFSKVFVNALENENETFLYGYLFIIIFSFVFQLILAYKLNKEALVKVNFKKALGLFMIYAILEGVMFACIFSLVSISTLYFVFGAVSVYYLLLAGLSFLLRKKINGLAGFAFAGLISLIVVSVISSILLLFFLNDPDMYTNIVLLVLIFGLVVFSILTIVDIKKMHELIDYSQNKNAASIAAAFCLYLDFINLFIRLLRLVAILSGNRRR